VSGMLASTCLTVLFVPSFFVILQRAEERLRGRSPGNLTPGNLAASDPAPESQP
jgi:hydrophobic/amphiphilic exporter-1 (mainly G- bacteria), HAE1 family